MPEGDDGRKVVIRKVLKALSPQALVALTWILSLVNPAGNKTVMRLSLAPVPLGCVTTLPVGVVQV